MVAWDTRISKTGEIFSLLTLHYSFFISQKRIWEFFCESAARISQLISQKDVWGTNCEIQGSQWWIPKGFPGVILHGSNNFHLDA